MRDYKVSIVPEEPLKNACVARMSVASNLALRDFDCAPFASGNWWLNRAAFRDNAKRQIAAYKVKTRTPETPIAELSGGNVQRAVRARELGSQSEEQFTAQP